MLNVNWAVCHIQALYAECHYAECRYADCCGPQHTYRGHVCVTRRLQHVLSDCQ
jgi:hypothetical protein